MDRRNVLKTAIAGSGGMLLSKTNLLEKNKKPSYWPPMRIVTSTYSFKQFDNKEYPTERVIEEAARMGFDGVEILMRRLESYDYGFLNKIKKLAFDAGLTMPLYSIHQSFVQPKLRDRQRDIDHTFVCIEQAVQLGIPCVRMNTGSWGTRRNNPNYYEDGIEEPLEGYSDEDAIQWVIDAMGECLVKAEREGVILALENHWGLSSNIDYLIRIYEALKSSPSMAINLDTGNFVGDPYGQFEKLVPYANIIQAKTYYGGGLYYDKEMDYERFGKIARDNNFTGYISLEFEGKEDPQIAVPKSLRELQKGFNGVVLDY